MSEQVRGRRALVSLSIAAALGCTAPPASPERLDDQAPAAAESHDQTYLIGIAWETGDMWCPAGARETQWANRRPTIAWVSTSGMPATAIDILAGRAVLARGRPADTPYSPFLADGEDECKSMQFENRTPRGPRFDWGGHPPITHFEITSLRPIAGPELRWDGTELISSFRNPLPFELRDIEFVVHYFPCFPAKHPPTPPPIAGSSRLAPGQLIEHRFPSLIPAELGSARAVHLQIVASGPPEQPPVHLDIDAPLDWLGVEVACPESER